VIYHFHNKGISVNKYVPSFIFRYFFRDAKVILSSKLLKYDIEAYVHDENIYYCPYGIPKEKVLFEKEESNRCRLLFFAHMIVEKGVYDLLNACKLLNEKGVDFTCNFVGGWYDVSATDFDKFVTTNNLQEKVFYLGPQYGNSKDKVLTNTDIFTFPTFYSDECFPLGILEAFRWNLPVISSPEGAISEIIEDGINGYLVPQRNIEVLADKIELLIKNPALRKQLGDAGHYKYEQKYTLEIFEERIAEIFQQVITKNLRISSYLTFILMEFLQVQ